LRFAAGRSSSSLVSTLRAVGIDRPLTIDCRLDEAVYASVLISSLMQDSAAANALSAGVRLNRECQPSSAVLRDGSTGPSRLRSLVCARFDLHLI
jgi:hypothetical protein